MLGFILVFLAGVLFAVGLGISGMTLPQKVLAFLDFAGDWDPSLLLVMITSAGVYLLLHRWVLKRSRPVFDQAFHVPTRQDIDQPLVAGAALFGIGWGLVGFCPGPAMTALVTGQTKVLIFFVSLAVGMYVYGTLDVLTKMRSEQDTDVDG
ncbi:MAG: DUF6691 family protein [Gammaproteobacteria bacterium]